MNPVFIHRALGALLCAWACGAVAVPLTVDGKANLWGAGLAAPPAPHGNDGGLLPVRIDLAPGVGRMLLVDRATGLVSGCCNDFFFGPDGNYSDQPGTRGTVDLSSAGSISGIRALHNGSPFLAGVFTAGHVPAGPPPTALTYSLDGRGGSLRNDALMVAPALNQVFFIGDGFARLDGGGDEQQRFMAPAGATTLYLGLVDGAYMAGPPAYYQDNLGAFEVDVRIGAAELPTVVPGPGGVPVLPFNFQVRTGLGYVIDPQVAVGYHFATGDGDPLFGSVVLPAGIGDNRYEVLLADGSLLELAGGERLDFTTLPGHAGGVASFRVTGIEVDAGLDPADPGAFATLVSFTGDGRFTGTMTPIVATVPAPSALALALLGLAALRPWRRQRGPRGGRGSVLAGAVGCGSVAAAPAKIGFTAARHSRPKGCLKAPLATRRSRPTGGRRVAGVVQRHWLLGR